MEKLLLADFSWLLYRFHHVKMELGIKKEDGSYLSTKQIYLFCSLVETVLRNKIADRIIFCQDLDVGEGEVDQRSEILSTYKEGRVHDPEVWRLVSDIKAILNCVKNVSFAGASTFEADDIMAQILFCHKATMGGEVVIFSGDNDLLQLIPYGAKISRKFDKGQFEFIDENYIISKFGVSSNLSSALSLFGW